LELSRLVAAHGEDEVVRRLRIGRGPLARGLAGLDVSERAGRRIVAGIWAEGQRRADPSSNGALAVTAKVPS
jgi:hypothetical protein